MKKLLFFVLVITAHFLVANSYAMVEVSVFNNTFTRGEGTPVTESLTFQGVTGPAIIRLTNGNTEDSDIEKVSSSIITVNGIIAFDSSNFNQNTYSMDAVVNLNDGINTIAVLLKSKPGGQINIDIFKEVDSDVASLIDTQGGVIEITDSSSPIHGAKITIPSGALTKQVIIEMKEAQLSNVLPSDAFVAGPVLDFGPDGTQFEKTVEISIPYSDIDNDGIIDGTSYPETSIGIKTFSSTNKFWSGIQLINIDTEANIVTFRADHFSEFVPVCGDIHGENLIEATNIDINTYRTGKINSEFDVDMFKVEIHRPGFLEIHTLNRNNITIIVYDSDYNQIAVANDPAFISILNQDNSSIVYPKHYYIAIMSDYPLRGEYNLLVDFYYKTENAKVFPVTFATGEFFDPEALFRATTENAITILTALGMSALKYTIPGGAILDFFFIMATTFDTLFDPTQLAPITCNLVEEGSIRGDVMMEDQAISYTVMLDYIGKKKTYFDTSFYTSGLTAVLWNGLFVEYDKVELLSLDEMRELNPNYSYVIIPDRPLKHDITYSLGSPTLTVESVVRDFDTFGRHSESCLIHFKEAYDEFCFDEYRIETLWYKDSDSDGYSDGIFLSSIDDPGSEYYEESELISIDGDCDDIDPNIYPGVGGCPSSCSDEICDGIDNDCDGEIDEGCETGDNPYFDFHVGDEMVYDLSPSDGSGWNERIINEQIKGTVLIGEEQFFRVEKREIYSDREDRIDTMYLSEDQNGDILYAFSENGTVQKALFNFNQYNVGDEWEETGVEEDIGNFVFRYRLESKTDTVQIPAGIFNHCVKIYIEQTWENDPGDNRKGYEWYAPGVGFIKAVNDKFKQVLVKAKVGNHLYNYDFNITPPDWFGTYLGGNLLSIYVNDNYNVDLDYTLDGGENWDSIASDVNGYYSWQLPELAYDLKNCYIRAISNDGNESSGISGRFNIFSNFSIDIRNPDDGDTYEEKTPIWIRWNTSGDVGESFDVAYNIGGSWNDIETNLHDDQYEWDVPGVTSDKTAQIRVRSNQYPEIQDVVSFAILDVTLPDPEIRITYPNNGLSIDEGTPIWIEWTTSGNVGNIFDVAYSLEGSSWIPIANNLSGTRWAWQVPYVTSDKHVEIRVRSDDDTSILDINRFLIQAQ